MRARLKTLPELKGEQALASDPAVHAALSASAGTGKTQVLTARVLRLLLKGARPESILCLTFTKAAAAEMANRIGSRLAAWVRLKDSDLAADLVALGESNDPITRQRARQLFARVLDCPGGLKIQTIHSFAQGLLAAFPAEAGLVPGFQPIEGRAEQELVRRTLADLMADAEAAADEPLIRDVQCLSRRLGEGGAVEYLQACARAPETLAALGPGSTIESKIRQLMRLPDESIEDYIANHCGDDRFDCDLLRAVADANRRWGAQTGLGHAEIIERLVEEFFSGSSETERRTRTLFMVGDFKQAIYGFQGTDPARFSEARAMFRRRAEELSEGETATAFRDLSIAASFRSAQPVLDVVDEVIETVGAEALALKEPPPPHRAHHRDRAGSVELWQPFAVDQSPDDSDEGEERWVSLRDRHYAGALAERIRQMIGQAPVLASTGRPLTPGDILVLVRSRGELASLIIARLFSAGVPVAGVDRLQLHEPLAVQDLIAAMRFAVQPDDDLSLACLLVSPLIGWDQDQLRDLAYGRKGSLWRELRRRASEFGQAQEALAGLLRIADFTTPARFLETILTGPMDGRRKLYSRLGMAARDAIDELMNSALEFERHETASLDRFLAWFSRGTVDVQRDPGRPANEVRVMTVHGAKGLEAPVVILADATADPARLGRTPITVNVEVEGAGAAPLLRPRKEERVAPFEEVILAGEKRDIEEHMRLLYVALTRAADRLIVSGVRPKERKDGADPRPPNCWHRIVEQAMREEGAVQADDHVVVRYGSAWGTRPNRAREKD